MEREREGDDHIPSTADAFAPPQGARSKKIVVAVATVVAVCILVVLLAVLLG